jgi:hypothetical protein
MFFELRHQDGSRWIVKSILGELLFADPKTKTYSYVEAFPETIPNLKISTPARRGFDQGDFRRFFPSLRENRN